MTECTYDLAGKKVFVAGHQGMVGSAIVRRLDTEDCEMLKSERSEMNLCIQSEVNAWFADNRPEVVFVAAAKVGGIHANSTYPAEFIYENLMIQSNLVHAAHKFDVGKLIFLGSTCIYPKMAPQPIKENALLSGALEETNQWYAIAKIAGIKLCESYFIQYGKNFISAQPTNLYGPGDNYDPENSHVLPALIRKAHEANLRNDPDITVWGTGKPLREFLHVDDLADALIFLAKNYNEQFPINVGSGQEVSIKELTKMICKVVGFEGVLKFDSTKPDGTPRKLCDSTLLKKLGWDRARNLEVGIRDTYRKFKAEFRHSTKKFQI